MHVVKAVVVGRHSVVRAVWYEVLQQRAGRKARPCHREWGGPCVAFKGSTGA